MCGVFFKGLLAETLDGLKEGFLIFKILNRVLIVHLFLDTICLDFTVSKKDKKSGSNIFCSNKVLAFVCEALKWGESEIIILNSN